ncbi:MAG: aromatic acid decarboxylase [Anaerolineaceae bacterium]|nr:aromatic acid decarboxylase [Anaerolineaceae bacterium]
MQNKKRIIVGISGASGAILGIEVLRALQKNDNVETHLVISTLAEKTIFHETDLSLNEIQDLADYSYPINELGATIASGSFETVGMVIVPCSMKTLAGVASGYSDNLLLRAADVCLKERRKLVIVPRETPYNGIHLRNLSFLHDQGVVILPAMMTFYHKPKSVQDMINQLTGKILSQFQIPFSDYSSWNGMDNDHNE